MKAILVGAGPGDPGLLTLKGRKALEEADVIVHDALASPVLLNFAKAGAELVYVGKVAGNHAMSQDAINELLVDKARANGGQLVVRLKGGDPYVFGRGGEEAEFLEARGIPFEVVPGVSSAIAAPAYAGIPLTHRGFASSLTLITGHEDPSKADSAHNWRSFATGGSTLVFLMGVKNLPAIAAKLMEHGMVPDTPAAIIYRGTTPMQRSLVATLKDLPQKAQAENFTNPSIIVIGKVVSLRDKLAWFEGRPLFGRRIVITRAREQASGMAAALENLGAEVIQCPTIRIEPLADYAMLDAALDNLSSYAWIIFTSANGVDYFWRRLGSRGQDARAFANAKIAAIGPGTAQALARIGLHPDLMPQKHVAESVASELLKCLGANAAGKKILIPRALKARMALPDILAKAGCIVDVAPVYQTLPTASCMERVAPLLREGAIDCVAFGSSSTVDNFFAALPPGLALDGRRPVFASIGPVTAATLQKHGFAPAIQPSRYTVPALVEAIDAWFQNLKENGKCP